MNIRPTELPLLRAEVLRDLQDIAFIDEMKDSIGKENRWFPGQLQRLLLDAGPAGELFYVSADMTRLTNAAVDSLPNFTLEAFDLPSRAGFIIFETPIARKEAWVGHTAGDIVGIMWDLADGQVCPIAYLCDTASMYAPGSPRPVGSRLQVSGLGFFIVGMEPSIEDAQFLPAHARIQGILKTAWLLMKQPLAVEDSPHPDRQMRRRMERAKVEPRPVRVIKLRRQSAQSNGESDRDYHHQWIVRGHWRQQWYPSHGVHRPVWIAPHLKGPEGAPMLGGEKVHAWTR